MHAFVARARARAQLGDSKGEIADLERVVALDPDSTEGEDAKERLAELSGKR